MTLTVCIGSSCHLKGSKKVAQTFDKLISQHNLKDKINFHATFCMGNCQEGVSVGIDDKVFSVAPDSAEEFFNKEVLSRLK